jgi:hypothetical protein
MFLMEVPYRAVGPPAGDVEYMRITDFPDIARPET